MNEMMSNWYECQKCFKPCDVRNSGVQHPLGKGEWLSQSVCCSAPVKVRSS